MLGTSWCLVLNSALSSKCSVVKTTAVTSAEVSEVGRSGAVRGGLSQEMLHCVCSCLQKPQTTWHRMVPCPGQTPAFRAGGEEGAKPGKWVPACYKGKGEAASLNVEQGGDCKHWEKGRQISAPGSAFCLLSSSLSSS